VPEAARLGGGPEHHRLAGRNHFDDCPHNEPVSLSIQKV
jgi:hypothetical protein